ncbi:hypothetical protein [Paenibacillus sp. YSY-4.3]
MAKYKKQEAELKMGLEMQWLKTHFLIAFSTRLLLAELSRSSSSNAMRNCETKTRFQGLRNETASFDTVSSTLNFEEFR